MSDINIDMEVISRWEPTGLIDGLPIWEKEELAILFDNTIRLILSGTTIKKVPKEVLELLEECSMPILRRLYRRVGVNFVLEEMLSKLLEEIESKKEYLSQEATVENNPIVDFCVDFADNYTDGSTSKNVLTDEEYQLKVDKMLKYLREVLLNNNLVTNVDKSEMEWKVNISDKKKSVSSTRFWNQKVAKELFVFSLSDINKGV